MARGLRLSRPNPFEDWPLSRIGLALVVAIIYGCQLWVMRGTLDEMKRSGKSATDQMWHAIGNINWLARTTDESLKQAGHAIEESRKQSIADRRPYVTIRGIG